jgi:acyl-CoA thioesterase-1
MKPPLNAITSIGVQHLRAGMRKRIRSVLVAVALSAALATAPGTVRAAFEYPTGDATTSDPTNPAGDTGAADAPPSQPRHECDVPAEIAPAEDPLPALVNALKDGPRPLTIVVLGSLSGTASPLVRDIPAFPPRLQTRLEAEFAARELELPLKVETVGRTRALAGELAALIKREVLPLKPALVLWQVGRGDARQANSPHRFGQSLKEGLDILQQAGIPTILADIQFHPQFEALYRTDDYRNYVRWVAGKRDLPLLRRYEMIEHWASAGSIDLDSGDDVDQQAAYRFIQECLAFQATRMILGGAGLTPRQ